VDEISCGSQEVPVTHLRKMMLEELQRRNYSEDTARFYIHTVEDFSRRFNCRPDRLSKGRGLRIMYTCSILVAKKEISAKLTGPRPVARLTRKMRSWMIRL
jgi:hypothetical protein